MSELENSPKLSVEHPVVITTPTATITLNPVVSPESVVKEKKKQPLRSFFNKEEYLLRLSIEKDKNNQDESIEIEESTVQKKELFITIINNRFKKAQRKNLDALKKVLESSSIIDQILPNLVIKLDKIKKKEIEEEKREKAIEAQREKERKESAPYTQESESALYTSPRPAVVWNRERPISNTTITTAHHPSASVSLSSVFNLGNNSGAVPDVGTPSPSPPPPRITTSTLITPTVTFRPTNTTSTTTTSYQPKLQQPLNVWKKKAPSIPTNTTNTTTQSNDQKSFPKKRIDLNKAMIDFSFFFLQSTVPQVYVTYVCTVP